MKRTIEIKLAEKEYTVSISFSVVERIEQRINLLDFLRQMQAMKPHKKDVAWIVYCAISDASKMSYNDVGELCLDYPDEANDAATDIILQILKPASETKKKEAQESQEQKGD